MSAKQQGVQPQGQELTTDGQTIHSSAPGAPGAMDPNLGGSRTPAVTGVPQGEGQRGGGGGGSAGAHAATRHLLGNSL